MHNLQDQFSIDNFSKVDDETLDKALYPWKEGITFGLILRCWFLANEENMNNEDISSKNSLKYCNKSNLLTKGKST